MGKLSRFFMTVLLIVSLAPLHSLTLLTGVDPNFPCGAHTCACASRKKCLEHCCCFPSRNRPPVPGGVPLMKSCGGGEEAAGLSSGREWISLGRFDSFRLPRSPRFIPAEKIYQSPDLDVLSPPPEVS